jgi:MFS family permease
VPSTAVRRTLNAVGQILYPNDAVARSLTWATMASAAGNGVFYTVSALFFTRVVGLDATTVGLGLTIAGGSGVAGAFAAGPIADRLGAHRVLLAATAGQGTALLFYVLARDAVSFTVIAGFAVGLRSMQGTARSAILARHFTGPDRVAVRARLRVVVNVFIGLGTCVAALALLADTAFAYTAAILLVGALTLLACLPLARLQRRIERDRATAPLPPGRTPTGTGPGASSPITEVMMDENLGPARSPLRDRRYLAVTGLNALMVTHFGLTSVGVPLWVVTHTRAPAVTISALLVLNTVLVALFQVAATRGTHQVRGAARAVVRAGGLLVVACALYAGSAAGGAVLAVGLLVLAATAHAAAETLGEAGSWGLAFELADARRAGAYQGVSQTGYAIGTMIAPALVTATAIEHGTLGWTALGLLYATAALLTWLVVRIRPDVRTASPDGVARIAA